MSGSNTDIAPLLGAIVDAMYEVLQSDAHMVRAIGAPALTMNAPDKPRNFLLRLETLFAHALQQGNPVASELLVHVQAKRIFEEKLAAAMQSPE